MACKDNDLHTEVLMLLVPNCCVAGHLGQYLNKMGKTAVNVQWLNAFALQVVIAIIAKQKNFQFRVD